MIIDCVSNVFTSEVIATRPDWSRKHMSTRFAVEDGTLEGVPVAEQLKLMDRAGVDKAILLAPIMGPEHSPGHWAMDEKMLLPILEAYPERFAGQVGLDPTKPVLEMRRLRSLVSDHGIVGAHIYPHWFDMAPDDRRLYPLYAQCADLGIPVQVQVGHCLNYSEERRLPSLGRPIALDTVACHFPDLKLIGSHMGWPWTEEMISVAYKHKNVFISTDAYAPAHWPAELVRFIDSWGRTKVMFGTMWPSIPWERAITEVRERGIRDESLALFLGGNASEVYGI